MPAAREARLLTERRGDMSIREAARRSGISEGSWRAYESRRKVKRMPGTLAAMARVVGITGAELTEAGRPDAAAELDQLPSYEAPKDDKQVIAELEQRMALLESRFERMRRPRLDRASGDDDDEEREGRRRAAAG